MRLALAFTFLRMGARGNGMVVGLCGGEIMTGDFQIFQFFGFSRFLGFFDVR